MISLTACTRNPYGPGVANWPAVPPGYPVAVPGGAAGGVPSGIAQSPPQMQEAQRRLQQLDVDNRQLVTQVAQLQQQNQALQQEKQLALQQGELYAKQLQDLAAQNKQLLASGMQIADQARSLQASMNTRGGARLTANNSLRGSAAAFQIPGAAVVPEGDLIRIRIPSDRLFSPGTAQLHPAGIPMLDQAASAISQQFPRQRVAVEAHTDNAQPYGASSAYRLAGDQAQAVLDQLVSRNRIPMQQLFTVAHGPNHPLADNQTPVGRAENRRIELVIYPETF